MKILIVGLGSMGKRRARLTKGIDSSIRIAGVDTAESRRVEATDLGLIDAAYPSIAEAVAAEAPDAALVCTAPLTHAAIISELLDNSLPVFTELNLVADGYEENMAKAKEKRRAAVSFFHHALPARNSVHQAAGGCIRQAGALYLPYWPVPAGLAPVGKLQKLFVGTPAPAACARFLALTCPGCWIPLAM